MAAENLAKLTKADLIERLESADSRAGRMSESFDKVMAALKREDREWTFLHGRSGHEEGLELEDLQEWSNKIEPLIAANPLVGGARRSRSALTWQDGIKHRGLPTEARGKGVNVEAFTKKPHNVSHYFGANARNRREGRLFAAGIAFYLGDDKTKELSAIPLREITGEVRDPDLDYEVWAYRRQWTVKDPVTSKGETRTEWYFTDLHTDKRSTTLAIAGRSGERETVSQTRTMFVQHANREDGFAYGWPDGIAPYIWAGIVRDADMDGITMTQALASIAYIATNNTPTGAENVALKLGGMTGGGNTVATGAANGLQPVSSAGRAYDFGGIDRLVSRVAVAADLPVAALLGEDVDKISLLTRTLIELRRAEHVEFERRVLRWMGGAAKMDKTEFEVYFEPMDNPDERYRDNQSVVLKWNTGLYTPKEIKTKMEALDGKTEFEPIPDGVLIPNNEASLPRKDIDPEGTGAAPKTTPAPDQGKSNKTGGKGNSGNDIRRD